MYGIFWSRKMKAKTALSLGLSVCPNCHRLNHDTKGVVHCSRCNSEFYQRKKHSLKYTLAWLIAATVMFFPANLYPIMNFSTLGTNDASTILGGIIFFLEIGMIPVALIIFIASFVVPLSKIAGIAILLYGVHNKAHFTPHQRTKLYRLVEFLGPWSMLDVFVVAIMAGVVQMGYVTFIEPTPGITYFALMVVFTMFSAESFDPRLLWDNQEHEE